MTKVVRCSDVGFDCEGVIRAENDQELLAKVAQHAKEAHGLTEVTTDIVAKVKSVIREE